jgi:hypothetical protein
MRIIKFDEVTKSKMLRVLILCHIFHKLLENE